MSMDTFNFDVLHLVFRCLDDCDFNQTKKVSKNFNYLTNDKVLQDYFQFIKNPKLLLHQLTLPQRLTQTDLIQKGVLKGKVVNHPNGTVADQQLILYNNSTSEKIQKMNKFFLKKLIKNSLNNRPKVEDLNILRVPLGLVNSEQKKRLSPKLSSSVLKLGLEMKKDELNKILKKRSNLNAIETKLKKKIGSQHSDNSIKKILLEKHFKKFLLEKNLRKRKSIEFCLQKNYLLKDPRVFGIVCN